MRGNDRWSDHRVSTPSTGLGAKRCGGGQGKEEQKAKSTRQKGGSPAEEQRVLGPRQETKAACTEDKGASYEAGGFSGIRGVTSLLSGIKR